MRSGYLLTLFLLLFTSSLRPAFAQFGPRVEIAAPAAGHGTVEPTDFNNDGKMDVLVYDGTDVHWFENLGSGNYSSKNIIFSSVNVSNVTAGDLDGDNLSDLIYTTHLHNLGWRKNLGGGTFGSPSLIYNLPHIDAGTHPLKAADMDNDGDIDVVVTDIGGLNSYFFIMINGGNGLSWTLKGDDPDVAPSYITTGDLNGDALPEVLSGASYTLSAPHYEISAFYNLGAGNTGPETPVVINPTDEVRSEMVVTDMDNDGDNDIVYCEYDNVSWAENTGGGSFSSHVAYSLPPRIEPYANIFCADMNGNGFKDIVIEDYTRQELVVIENLGGGTFGNKLPISTNIPAVYNTSIFVMDADGDGDPDIFSGTPRPCYYENLGISGLFYKGTIYFDANQNKVKDPGENGIGFIPVEINPDHAAFYSTNGNYELYTPPGSHTVTYQPFPNWGLTTDSASYTRTVTLGDPVVDSLDFGFYPSALVTDISTVLSGSRVRCNLPGNLWISLTNKGSSQPGGVIALQLDSGYTFHSSPMLSPDSVAGQNVYWSYDSLYYFQSLSFNVKIQASPTSLLGDTFTSVLRVHETDGAGNVIYTNTDTLFQIFTCSYDPNEKIVYPGGITEKGYVLNGASPEYTINFQNLGNDTAFYVRVEDQLDTNLDWSAFDFLASSHPAQVSIDQDGMVIFEFNDIELPDSIVDEPGSHGFVKYRIDMKPGLPAETEIHNSAAIYFDSNPPVLTNDVVNTIYNCSKAFSLSAAEICKGDTLTGVTFATDMPNEYRWDIDAFYQDHDSLLSWKSDTAGIFNATLTISNPLCTVDSTIAFEVHPTYSIDTEESICAGDSIFLDGAYRKSAGVYEEAYQSISGCDSTMSITLSVDPSPVTNQQFAICQGDSMLIAGAYRSTPGVYVDVLPSAKGCDSTVNTTLVVNPAYDIAYPSLSVCQGEGVIIFGAYRNQAGTYYDSLQTTSGCDSILSLSLAIEPSYSSHQSEAICDGDSLLLYGKFQDQAGTYYDSLQTVMGCDSIFSTELKVFPNYDIQLPALSICGGDSIMIFSAYERQPGIYQTILPTAHGCDSMLTVELAVKEVDTTVSLAGNVLTATAGAEQYQWISCDDGTAIAGEVQREFAPQQNGLYAVSVTQDGCIDTSSCYAITTIGILQSDFDTELLCYPNPARDMLYIDLGRTYDHASIRLSDMAGRDLQLFNFNNRQLLDLNISHLPPGIYLLHLQAGVHRSLLKMVKEE